jgi:hypothetical protein
MGFVNNRERKPQGDHPLIGRGLHYKDAHDRVSNQAKVIAVMPSGTAMGDLVLIQYYAWVAGEPSTQRLLPLTELASSDRWVFYENTEEMNDHYERIDSARHKLIVARLMTAAGKEDDGEDRAAG